MRELWPAPPEMGACQSWDLVLRHRREGFLNNLLVRVLFITYCPVSSHPPSRYELFVARAGYRWICELLGEPKNRCDTKG
jgi:hypothetical protein